MFANILLIADDRDVFRILYQNLHNRGYQVSIAVDNNSAIEICRLAHPDLIILNSHFSKHDIDGIMLCREIRKSNRCPIIIFSMFGTEADRIRALDSGADDYLDIPLNIEEFMAHVRSALRRWMDYKKNSPCREHSIICGDLIINSGSREVTLLGGTVKLTRTEFDILNYLAEKNGNVATHSEMLNEIWGPEFKTQKENIRVFISQLRHKIEPDPVIPSYILTEPGIGYRIRMEFE